MVTYYIGNIREKRLYFRKRRIDAALADNCDVLADFKLNGKVCFVLGDIPYGNMRVGEYLGYARALKTRLPLSASAAKQLLRRAGTRVSLQKKMRTLSRLTFRGVLLAAALTDATTEVWLNLDGIAYSALSRMRMRHKVRKVAKYFKSVHVAVSDYRFIPYKANVMAATNNAVVHGKSRSASRYVGKLHIGRKIGRSCDALRAFNGKPALVCDN